MIDVQKTRDWLIDGAPGAATSPEVLKKTGDQLSACGVRLDRAEAFVRTLHPNVAGRSFAWMPGQSVVVEERSYGWLSSPAFAGTPMAGTCETGEYRRARISADNLPHLAADGYTDLFATPLRFLHGQTHVLTFITRHPDGFRDDDLEAIRSVVPPMARVAEILALMRTATNLLDTYVGHNAGGRILRGQIRLGDTTTVRALIWFSDLRGFTVLSQSVPPVEVIRALNDLFACQIPSIEKRGGEVLKFIGDGLLAIFPIDDAAAPGKRANDAVDAAKESLAALVKMNASRGAIGSAPLSFGLALHLGDVAYGNIGGANRLDFTCIGEAVNVAARLEALTAKLSRPVVLSEVVAKLVTAPTEDLGSFELKGVAAPHKAFGLVGV